MRETILNREENVVDVIAIAQTVESGTTAKGGNRFDVLLTSGMTGFVATQFSRAGDNQFFVDISRIIGSRQLYVFDIEISVYNGNPQYQFGRKKPRPFSDYGHSNLQDQTPASLTFDSDVVDTSTGEIKNPVAFHGKLDSSSKDSNLPAFKKAG